MKIDWLKQADEFNKIWEKRYQPPYVRDSWINNEWAKGRTNYLTFLARVRDKQIIDSIKKIQTELADYRCADTFPEKYLHITIKELNCFLVSEKRFPDEYTEEELPRLIKAAKEKLYPFKQFILRLENLNNFKSTVCIQAHDGGVIRNINRALLQIPSVYKLQNDYPRFLPHVSIAQYKSIEDYERLIKYLEEKFSNLEKRISDSPKPVGEKEIKAKKFKVKDMKSGKESVLKI